MEGEYKKDHEHLGKESRVMLCHWCVALPRGRILGGACWKNTQCSDGLGSRFSQEWTGEWGRGSLLSDALGPESDSCAGDSQVHSREDRGFSHPPACGLLPAAGAAGIMSGPRGLSSVHSPWHHQPSPLAWSGSSIEHPAG